MFAVAGEPFSCRQRLFTPRRMDGKVPGDSIGKMSPRRHNFSGQSDYMSPAQHIIQNPSLDAQRERL